MVDQDMLNSVSQPAAHIPPKSAADDVFGLAEDLGQLGRISDLMTEYLQEHLGLTHQQLQLLARVAEGPQNPSALGADEALAVLTERDLITGDGDQVALTEQGKVVLDQVEAIRIRLADRLVSDLGAAEARSLRTVVQQLITATAQPTRSIA